MTNVDNSNRLYSVENLLSAVELADIRSIDWLSLPTMHNMGQDMLPTRVRVDATHPSVLRVNTYICNAFDSINAALGTNFMHPVASVWWIDNPGFNIPVHTDNVKVTNALQMYWIMPGEDYGTCFYRDLTVNNPNQLNRNIDQIEITHQFISKPNYGYIMLNEEDATGNKPAQWHGMLNTVPLGTFRLTSYSVVPRNSINGDNK